MQIVLDMYRSDLLQVRGTNSYAMGALLFTNPVNGILEKILAINSRFWLSWWNLATFSQKWGCIRWGAFVRRNVVGWSSIF